MKDFYTFDDLSDRALLDEGSDLPARLAIIGYPARQSKSPQMQQAALDSLGKKIRYIRLELSPEEFSRGVDRLADLGFVGANVTYPHKQAAFKKVNQADTLSQQTGAVNTLLFNEGQIYGFNTDGPGFAAAIRDTYFLDIRDLRIVLLGAAGGAGTSIAFTCASNHCERLILANRTLEKALTLEKQLAPCFIDENRLSGAADRLTSITLSDNKALEEAIREADIIVNATSLGLSPLDPSPIPASWILPSHIVFDTVTQSTQLQSDAISQGARVTNGVPMLIHQGALSFKHWFHTEPDLQAMKNALNQA